MTEAQHTCLCCGETAENHESAETDHAYVPSLQQIVAEHDPEGES